MPTGPECSDTREQKMDYTQRASVQVAPLKISKDQSHLDMAITEFPVPNGRSIFLAHEDSQMTPPLTPSDPERTHLGPGEPAHLQFHHYLRAFHPFHPEVDDTSTTITLPLNMGDVILVHSVHTNGWADGTLLDSGARGWLPTNYCIAYDEQPMRNLMRALTNFWDLVRDSSDGNYEAFKHEFYTRGLVAGVRYLLVSTPASEG